MWEIAIGHEISWFTPSFCVYFLVFTAKQAAGLPNKWKYARPLRSPRTCRATWEMMRGNWRWPSPAVDSERSSDGCGTSETLNWTHRSSQVFIARSAPSSPVHCDTLADGPNSVWVDQELFFWSYHSYCAWGFGLDFPNLPAVELPLPGMGQGKLQVIVGGGMWVKTFKSPADVRFF